VPESLFQSVLAKPILVHFLERVFATEECLPFRRFVESSGGSIFDDKLFEGFHYQRRAISGLLRHSTRNRYTASLMMSLAVRFARTATASISSLNGLGSRTVLVVL